MFEDGLQMFVCQFWMIEVGWQDCQVVVVQDGVEDVVDVVELYLVVDWDFDFVVLFVDECLFLGCIVDEKVEVVMFSQFLWCFWFVVCGKIGW